MKGKLEYVRRLVLKARNDLRSAQDLMRTADPATDVICFHSQQDRSWLRERSSPTCHIGLARRQRTK